MTELFVSPHLDDAALSCAGRLAELARRDRVVVATLFTEGAPAYQARRDEDRAALQAIGVEAVHLGLLDAPYRLGIGFRFGALALGPPPAADDVAAAADALGSIVAELSPSRVWFPLAVGGHVDHRVAFSCHRVAGERAVFFVDRPYAFSTALMALRRVELEGGRVDAPPSAAAIGEALSALPVLNGMFGANERDRCIEELAARLAQHRAATGLRMTTRSSRYSMKDLGVIEAYGSQLGWLGGYGAIVDVYRRWASEDGELVEDAVVIETAP